MCKCHYFDKEERKMKRTKGVFSLKSGNVGETFKFEHENFLRKIIEMNFKSQEVYAPPIEDFNGLTDKGEDVFHFSFKVQWGY